jgi:hypothetical protein
MPTFKPTRLAWMLDGGLMLAAGTLLRQVAGNAKRAARSPAPVVAMTEKDQRAAIWLVPEPVGYLT